MTMQILEGYVSQALSCSQQMYFLAEQQEWDRLSNLESERAVILETLFDHPDLPMFLAKIADRLRHIIEIDQQTMAMGRQSRQALNREMELLNQGKRAVDAYLGYIH